jgi:hypothetical protein
LHCDHASLRSHAGDLHRWLMWYGENLQSIRGFEHYVQSKLRQLFSLSPKRGEGMSLLYEVPRVDGDRPPTPLSSWARFRDAVSCALPVGVREGNRRRSAGEPLDGQSVGRHDQRVDCDRRRRDQALDIGQSALRHPVHACGMMPARGYDRFESDSTPQVTARGGPVGRRQGCWSREG